MAVPSGGGRGRREVFGQPRQRRGELLRHPVRQPLRGGTHHEREPVPLLSEDVSVGVAQAATAPGRDVGVVGLAVQPALELELGPDPLDV